MRKWSYCRTRPAGGTRLLVFPALLCSGLLPPPSAMTTGVDSRAVPVPLGEPFTPRPASHQSGAAAGFYRSAAPSEGCSPALSGWTQHSRRDLSVLVPRIDMLKLYAQGDSARRWGSGEETGHEAPVPKVGLVTRYKRPWGPRQPSA